MAIEINYFVHGTTLDNLQHKATGWLPGELSEKGIERVLALKNLINIEDFDIVFCSDLKRAVDSAKYIFGGKKEIIEDSRLRECNYGDLNGSDSNLINYKEHINNPFPNGESLVDVEKRVCSFCKYLLENFDGKKIAIVAHRAPQLAIRVLTERISWNNAINTDWRKNKNWQPGWKYLLN